MAVIVPQGDVSSQKLLYRLGCGDRATVGLCQNGARGLKDPGHSQVNEHPTDLIPVGSAVVGFAAR